MEDLSEPISDKDLTRARLGGFPDPELHNLLHPLPRPGGPTTFPRIFTAATTTQIDVPTVPTARNTAWEWKGRNVKKVGE